MRDIYEAAEQTLICLSTQGSYGEGMKWFVDLCADVPIREDDLEVETPKEAKLIYQRVFCPSNFATERHHWHRLVDRMSRNVRNENFTGGWIAFHNCLESPWWSRAWVFQEFIVSV
jgi:hypothetical protein